MISVTGKGDWVNHEVEISYYRPVAHQVAPIPRRHVCRKKDCVRWGYYKLEHRRTWPNVLKPTKQVHFWCYEHLPMRWLLLAKKLAAKSEEARSR